MATFHDPSAYCPKIRGRYVLYLRRSEKRYSRLNADAQERAAARLISQCPARIVDTFTEVEPLVAGDRPELEAAIAACKAHNAKILFGKMHQMRGLGLWRQRLREERIGISAVDVPESSDYLLKLLNSHRSWRIKMSETVSEALEKAKAEGVTLGGPRGNPEHLRLGPSASARKRQIQARRRDGSTIVEIRRLQKRGVSTLADLAIQLNQEGLAAPRGGLWSPNQVRRVIKKFED